MYTEHIDFEDILRQQSDNLISKDPQSPFVEDECLAGRRSAHYRRERERGTAARRHGTGAHKRRRRGSGVSVFVGNPADRTGGSLSVPRIRIGEPGQLGTGQNLPSPMSSGDPFRPAC
ncbi:hypothetical protein F2P81_002524 [Scophthalmus maximus]|uniref:Uncharacterized protein n=1 Tax=Scophthalmus maximus TaxID=52904 RepID=A0A6A4TL77_SCOMX|nr:hypothetical protein F2P81_002524 [Scophthalmus maximus]